MPGSVWFSSFFRRKRFLVGCTIMFTLASLLCGFAASMPMLVIARVLQGLGGGAMQPLSQAILLESFPPAKRVGNEKEAIGLVDTIDEDRRKFVKQYFGHDWPNRDYFHAMLNTGIGDDNVVETILNLLNAANKNEEAAKT